MKKFLLTLTTAFLLGSFATSSQKSFPISYQTKQNSQVNDKKTVEYKNFTELPKEFVGFENSDVTNSYVSTNNNDLIIEHDKTKGPNNKKYYGAVYKISPQVKYTDFSFEMEFKMTNWADGARWIGVGYHLRDDSSNNMTGYLMNYRMQDGRSAYSTIDSSQNFHDVALGGNKRINDGAYHKLAITMNGNIATHYMDGQELVKRDVTNSDSLLNGTYNDGYFALFVNRSTINIKNITIKNYFEGSSVFDDSNLVETYQSTSKIANEPTIVSEVLSLDDLEKLKGDVKPSNVILRFNKDKNIVTSSGDVLGSANAILNDYLTHSIIPIFKITSTDDKDALVDFLENDRKLFDVAVLSKDDSLIKGLKDKISHVRGILDVETLTSNTYEVVKKANLCGANTILLNENDATEDNIYYIQSRFKTVWTKIGSLNENDLHNAIFSGTCGLINNDFIKLYETIVSYDDEYLLTRKPFNVAHRGLPKKTNECSLDGLKKSIKAGATHVELDAYMTMDKQIIFSHDRTLDRCTNGVGNLEQMTYAQVRQYVLDLFEPNEALPDIYEILDVIKENDVVLVLEIKSEQTDLVNVLKSVLDEYGVYDKVVTISFHHKILEQMHKVLPQVPIADLNTCSTSNFKTKLEEMGKYNSVIDTHAGNKLLNEAYLRDRGILGWYWTMDDEASLDSHISDGLVGLTNNIADVMGEHIKKIEIDPQANLDFKVGDELKVRGIKYNKESVDVTGTIEKIKTENNKTFLSLKYKDGIANYITPFIEVEKLEAKPPIEDNKEDETKETDNTLIIVLSVLGGIALIGLIVGSIFLYKRKAK